MYVRVWAAMRVRCFGSIFTYAGSYRLDLNHLPAIGIIDHNAQVKVGFGVDITSVE
jgi:hypothetical protein